MATTTQAVPAVTTKAAAPVAIRVLSWVLRILLAAFMINAARPKLAADPMMITAFTGRGGTAMMYTVGSLEVAAAIGLLVPILSGFAAIGLAALMVIFAIVEISSTGPATAVMSSATLLVTLVVLYLQRAQVPRLTRTVAGLRRR